METVNLAAILPHLYIKYIGEGETKWKELISPKKDKEVKNMDLEKEWKLPVEEKY